MRAVTPECRGADSEKGTPDSRGTPTSVQDTLGHGDEDSTSYVPSFRKYENPLRRIVKIRLSDLFSRVLPL